MQRAPSWISLWLTPDPKAMEAQCSHGTTRTHWQARGPAPPPEGLAVMAILGHQVRLRCPCSLGLWQQPHPNGNCLAIHGHDRALTPEDRTSLQASPAVPPAVYWRVYP